MDDLEAKAREWLQTHCSHESFAVFGETWTEPLAALLRSVASKARKEALEDAAKQCDRLVLPPSDRYSEEICSETAHELGLRIRAIAGRKEGT